MKLRLSDTAKAHLDDIRTYTIETFGVRQWLVYSGALEEGFSTLLRFPEIGFRRDQLPRGYKAFRIREHWICYRLGRDEILIGVVVRYVSDFQKE